MGPYEIIDPASIEVVNDVEVTFSPMQYVGTIDIKPDYSIVRSVSSGYFFGKQDQDLAGLNLQNFFSLNDGLKKAVDARFANESAPRYEEQARGQKRAIDHLYAPRL